MARNKFISSLLVIMLMLAVLVAPVLAGTPQTSLASHVTGISSSSILAGPSFLATPALIACEGCSGGGSGPG